MLDNLLRHFLDYFIQISTAKHVSNILILNVSERKRGCAGIKLFKQNVHTLNSKHDLGRSDIFICISSIIPDRLVIAIRYIRFKETHFKWFGYWHGQCYLKIHGRFIILSFKLMRNVQKIFKCIANR